MKVKIIRQDDSKAMNEFSVTDSEDIVFLFERYFIVKVQCEPEKNLLTIFVKRNIEKYPMPEVE